MDKNEIIAELRRVAEILQSSSLTISQFKQYGRVSDSAVMKKFGSWNEAIEAAGLVPIPSGLPSNRKLTSDEEYLQEIIRLTKEIGKQPTVAQMSAKGRFSEDLYRKRWGSLAEACKVAYATYGFPLSGDKSPITRSQKNDKCLTPPSERYQQFTSPNQQHLAKRFNTVGPLTSEDYGTRRLMSRVSSTFLGW